MTAAVLVLGGGGAAFAYWTSTGTGSGQAQTGTSTNFTVTAGTATGAALTPGGPAQTVPFTVANPGTGAQTLANVVVTVAKADGTAFGTASPGCSAADYTVGTPVITYGPVAPNGGTISGTVTVSMKNLTTNQDLCKNVVVPLYFVAS